MNQTVTGPPSVFRAALAPDEAHELDGDFLARLDEKLRRRNERLIEKLLAWADLLDLSGWCVALDWAGGDFWLSGRARMDLERLGGVPSTWADLLAAMDGLSADSVHQKSEGVILWSGPAPFKDAMGPEARLTRREMEVRSWLCKGKTGYEIAVILGCSTRTVEKHLANLYRKLGVKNRAEVLLKTLQSTN